jgi:hypothetical protein
MRTGLRLEIPCKTGKYRQIRGNRADSGHIADGASVISMRCSVISLLSRSGNFCSLAGKQQGAIFDEQGIWFNALPRQRSAYAIFKNN